MTQSILRKINIKQLASFGLIIGFSVVMFLFLFLSSSFSKLTFDDASKSTGYFFISLIFTFLFATGVFAFYNNAFQNKLLLFTLFLFCFFVLLAVRFYMLNAVSGDYDFFLRGWVDNMRGKSISEAVSEYNGDYNMSYLYILYIISLIKLPDLFLIKAVSVGFDIMLAYYVSRLVQLKTQKTETACFAFLITLAIPTVILNSSFWAQCDSIYVAFCLGGLYYGIKNRGITSMVMFALGFAFKMQTVFILPIVLVLMLAKKIKVWHAVFFPLTFLATILPARFFGVPFIDIIKVYLNQTKTYKQLYCNTPTIWTFFPQNTNVSFTSIGVLIAFCAMVVLIYFAYSNLKKFKDTDFVVLSFLLTFVIIFLLPRMHERYFYITDILAVIYFIYNKKHWFVPLCLIATSFICYSRFLFGDPGVFSFQEMTIIQLLIGCFSIYSFYNDISKRETPQIKIEAANSESNHFDLDIPENETPSADNAEVPKENLLV